MNATRELQRILDADIRFTLQREDDSRFLVKLGDYHEHPEAEVLVDTFEEAVAWLREQVKFRFPHASYSKIRLTS